MIKKLRIKFSKSNEFTRKQLEMVANPNKKKERPNSSDINAYKKQLKERGVINDKK